MKYYTFRRESNNFNDILNDPEIKKNMSIKIKWKQHCLIGFKEDIEDSILGYVVLKYGDDIVKLTQKDYSPIPNIDYMINKSRDT